MLVDARFDSRLERSDRTRGLGEPSSNGDFETCDLLRHGRDSSEDVTGQQAHRELVRVVNNDRVVDVQFRAFVADPLSTVRTVYQRFGLELSPAVEARMQAFLAANPQEKHGGHRYAFADTGLDAGELRERARRYQEYFDVPSER